MFLSPGILTYASFSVFALKNSEFRALEKYGIAQISTLSLQIFPELLLVLLLQHFLPCQGLHVMGKLMVQRLPHLLDPSLPAPALHHLAKRPVVDLDQPPHGRAVHIHSQNPQIISLRIRALPLLRQNQDPAVQFPVKLLRQFIASSNSSIVIIASLPI